ncbi:MAG TPA: phage tail sheath C-terminal domain-containing protein [Thiobacillaceae bacterium]|nr:phage tail sheath C-terminal domain-containing protein [Thiobacillaceae bacterium]HNA83413.1 phage tail sheath C-terminal domain-containing protein [Thiobacillaceae bacterium]HNF87953.1 phage tail sheath C-terminal domain-containing protein [Thiobacillaceae bacterium]HNI08625.1 phage tail sheath C-terminal domain-containing protein [Thiobacillaceae bacterium]
MVQVSYPGVYVQEKASGVRTITGVATSITAFIGRALRGPVDEAVRIQSFADYTRRFGGLWADSPMSYALSHFFLHGGSDAIVVRVFNGDVEADSATITLPTATGSLVLAAASPGAWGNRLRARVDHLTRDTADTLLFNLTVEELDAPGGTRVVNSETFRNVSVAPTHPRFVDSVLAELSGLVRVSTSAPDDESPTDTAGSGVAAATTGDDGDPVTDLEISDAGLEADRRGLWALESVDLFNLLCIPPLERETDVGDATWTAASAYCRDRRAFLVVDSPATWSESSDPIGDATTGIDDIRATITTENAPNSAVYFPRLRMADPLAENRPALFAPCGAVAGIMARTDAQRGVWKAPAGLEASLAGVSAMAYKMTDAENGILNPLGLNCLRTMPVSGHLVWGARTLIGADQLASEWKYIPIRRLALFIEESLYRGTQWVVFEPNDEPLWAKIRLNVGVFMNNLFRQGAFQGGTASEAYFVKCDAETTTQADRNLGIVNIEVGFAPLKPAEFVVLSIQQIAGDLQ